MKINSESRVLKPIQSKTRKIDYKNPNIKANFDSKIQNLSAGLNAKSVSMISFHGLFTGPSIDTKIATAANKLDNQSIMLIGTNFEDARDALNTVIEKLNFPIIDIYFVENKALRTPCAVYKKDKDYYLFNISPFRWSIMDNKDSFKDKLDKRVDKGESAIIKEGNYFQETLTSDEKIMKFTLSGANDAYFGQGVEKESYFDNTKNLKSFNQSHLLKLSRTNKTNVNDKTSSIKFSDIGALDYAIKELEEKVIFPIKYPDAFKNIRINKGILLYGPPRCGKTMLGLAMANELNANYIKISANELTDDKVGRTEKNWRELFQEARANQPSIIFIDEFDGVGIKRSSSDMARYQNTVVNEILNEMSMIEKSDDMIFVVAATNNRNIIDNAMKETGRFGLQIEIKPPNLKGTGQIFDLHSRNININKDFDEEQKTLLMQKMYVSGFTGSDIAEVISLSHYEAMNRLKIFEKMRNDTYSSNDMKNFDITKEDLFKAYEKLLEQKKSNEKEMQD